MASRCPTAGNRVGPLLVTFLVLGGLGLPLMGAYSAAALPPVGGSVGLPSAAPIVAHRPPVAISPPRLVPHLPEPAASGVNPYAFLQAEPASLGITDYGVNSAGAGYTYSTPIWWADANISRLLAYYPSKVQGDGFVTFQLNVVVKFTAPDSTQFAYWVQDVVQVDTITDQVVYLDNVWNLSAGGSIENGTLTGNGSLGAFGSGYFYGDSPNCQGQTGGYPGNCRTLAYPAIITERVTTGRYEGVPHVAFQYADGSSWVTYDNVSFPFAANYQDHDFTVDGTQYTPLGLFYDGEWDYTGPGGTMDDRNTSMEMSLQRWNGHNLQAPPNAFNFGSNTGESISNVVSAAELNTTNGTVGAQVTTGAGSLGPLYFSSDVGTVNVSTPTVTDGIITIGGAPHPFVGTTAVFTLAPGTYNISLWDGTNWVASTLTTVYGGVTSHLYLGYPTPYTVEFVELGLPGTLSWSLTVGGIAYPNPGPSLALELANGTYAYSVLPVAGYTLPTYAANFTVQGSDLTLYVNFTAFELPVTFSEAGLASGTSWSVTLGSSTLSSTGSSIVFDAANGTYPYSVDAGLTYQATPSSSAVTVQGFPQYEPISFALQPGYLTGQVTPASASIFVGGSEEPTFNGTFNLSLLPGVYTVEVSAPGYVTKWTNVTIAPAATVPLGVELSPSNAGGGGGSSSGSTGLGGGVSLGTAVLLIGVAAVVGVAVVAAAIVAARRRQR